MKRKLTLTLETTDSKVSAMHIHTLCQLDKKIIAIWEIKRQEEAPFTANGIKITAYCHFDCFRNLAVEHYVLGAITGPHTFEFNQVCAPIESNQLDEKTEGSISIKINASGTEPVKIKSSPSSLGSRIKTFFGDSPGFLPLEQNKQQGPKGFVPL